MLFSDLIGYRNLLLALSTDHCRSVTSTELDKVMHLATGYDVLDIDSKQRLDQARQHIEQSYTKFDLEVDKIKREIQDIVAPLSTIHLQESSLRYEDTIRNRAVQQPEYINLDRHLSLKIPEQDRTMLTARLSRLSDWRYPGLIIHPGQESWIDVLTASDPLYILDDRHELLEPAVERFPEIYRDRLCKHVIEESLDGNEILRVVPKNQFGICLVYNYLHWRPFEVVCQYLQEILQKLRAGGVLIMTINDCDRPPAIKLVEQKWCYYTPLSMVLDYAQRLGYTVEYTWTDGGAATWVELRKPGELTSLRGGQALAKILSKPIAESK